MNMPSDPVDYPWLVMLRIDVDHEAMASLAVQAAIRALELAGIKVMSHGRAKHDRDGCVMVNTFDGGLAAESEWRSR